MGKVIDPDPGDFSGDCVTNVIDLNELTGTWLADSTSTEAFAREMTGGSGNDPDDDPNSPDVEAGSDWNTWTGEPVTVNATVVNNDPNEPKQMPLTYAWTADAISLGDPSLTVDITNEDQEDATVTITKISYFAPFVANGGFEMPALDDDNSVNTNDVPFWSTQYSTDGTGPWTNDNSPNGGAIDPNAANYGYGGVAPGGENIGYLEPSANDHCLYQELSATVQASAEHVLSVKVGNPSLYNAGAGPKYRIELLAGDVVIASASGDSPADDSSWLSVSCSSTAGADDVADPNVGQTLAIRLVAEEREGGDEVNFDDVELLIDGEAGADDYGMMVTVTLTLAANNVKSERDDVVDTMTIDVYEGPCKATIFDPADDNEDCITNLKDFAVMALDWLNDYTITAPVARPESSSTGSSGRG